MSLNKTPNSLQFQLGDYIYFSNTVGDAVGDARISDTGNNFYIERCTVANAAKGGGTWVEQQFNGEMYAYNKTIALNVIVSDTYQAIYSVGALDIIAGVLNNFTFYAGVNVDANITSEADNGGKLQIVTSAAHGLSNGDLVVCGNMNNAGHNKPTEVMVDNATTFTCNNINYVAGAGASAGFVDRPAYLLVGTNAAGTYKCSLTIDGTASNANKDWKFEVNNGITAKDNIVARRTSTATMANMTAHGLITVAAGDKIWVSYKNATDTTDYTITNFNLNLFR